MVERDLVLEIKTTWYYFIRISRYLNEDGDIIKEDFLIWTGNKNFYTIKSLNCLQNHTKTYHGEFYRRLTWDFFTQVKRVLSVDLFCFGRYRRKPLTLSARRCVHLCLSRKRHSRRNYLCLHRTNLITGIFVIVSLLSFQSEIHSSPLSKIPSGVHNMIVFVLLFKFKFIEFTSNHPLPVSGVFSWFLGNEENRVSKWKGKHFKQWQEI